MPNEEMNKLQVMSEMSIHELWEVASIKEDELLDDELSDIGVTARAVSDEWVTIEPQDAQDFLRTMRDFLNSPNVHSVIRKI